MRYTWKQINTEPVPFKYIEYTIFPNDDIYMESLVKAEILAPQMNRHAPDGRMRSSEEILYKCAAGCIAEKIVVFFINTMAEYFNADVLAHEVVFDRDVDDDQVDVVVESQSDSVKIEVRSSFARVPNDQKRYCEWFSIVGYYTSANKAREIAKDYYITVIFNGEKDFIIESLSNNQPVTVQIAAGCSKEYLRDNGMVDSLKNRGATYRVIKPLINGVPVSTLAKQIFSNLQ